MFLTNDLEMSCSTCPEKSLNETGKLGLYCLAEQPSPTPNSFFIRVIRLLAAKRQLTFLSPTYKRFQLTKFKHKLTNT